jgi:two-component system response regulator AtoC
LNFEANSAGPDLGMIEDSLFVARGPAMLKIRENIELLAKVDVPVLIRGESGSGRETVARLIHQLSKRAKYKFAKVNCAGLDDDMVEHELFGSMSSSVAPGRAGALLLCDGGTILLQEITHVNVRVQAKLLELMQDHHFGNCSNTAVDVRILASTESADFDGIQKRLRKDFGDRLSAFTIQIPPLRERPEELGLLAEHFMHRMARRHGLTPRPFSNALMRAIEEHGWPGNLRELEIFVQRYVVMGDEHSAVNEIPSRVFVADSSISTKSSPDLYGKEDASALKSLVRSVKGEAERTAIVNILEKTHWNRKEAARSLGISYRSLLYKIEQYQLSPLVSANGFKATRRKKHVSSVPNLNGLELSNEKPIPKNENPSASRSLRTGVVTSGT